MTPHATEGERAIESLIDLLVERLLLEEQAATDARDFSKPGGGGYTEHDLQDGAAIRRQSHRSGKANAGRRPSHNEDE